MFKSSDAINFEIHSQAYASLVQFLNNAIAQSEKRLNLDKEDLVKFMHLIEARRQKLWELNLQYDQLRNEMIETFETHP